MSPSKSGAQVSRSGMDPRIELWVFRIGWAATVIWGGMFVHYVRGFAR